MFSTGLLNFEHKAITSYCEAIHKDYVTAREDTLCYWFMAGRGAMVGNKTNYRSALVFSMTNRYTLKGLCAKYEFGGKFLNSVRKFRRFKND